MKMYFSLVLLLSISLSARAQGTLLKEWIKQKKTQREYLIKQIAALQVYINFARRGYEIYDKGLNLIGSLKNGEFNLHSDFFLSLKGINPEIARYARVADIINLQVQTVRACNRSLNAARDGGRFSANEVDYLSRVYGRLLEDCAGLVDELINLTTSGKLEMSDDERLQRIDLLYTEMQDKYGFAKGFGSEVITLDRSRAREKRDIEISIQLNNLRTD